MKAAIYEGPHDLKVKEVDKPICTDETMVVRVKACAICGTDLKTLKDQDVKINKKGQKHMHYPRIPGHEFSGIVEEIGSGVREYQVGDRVTVSPSVPCGECHYCRRGNYEMCDELKAISYDYDGAFAEYILVPPLAIKNRCVNIVPEDVSLEEAALTEPLSCAVNCHELSGTKLGDRVLIIGAGPLGCLCVELAKFLGASKVMLAELSSSRLKLAQRAKSDVYINVKEEDIVESVLRETNRRGANIIIVAAPSSLAQKQSLKMIAKKGTINFFAGLPRSNSVIGLDSNIVHYRELKIVGTHGSSPLHNEIALNLISEGKTDVKKYITHTLPLEDILKGMEIAAKGIGLKVIITP